MTLILSFASPKVVQVSDRKATDYATGEVVNDTTTKLIIFNRCALFGVSGIGRLENQPAHRWVTSTPHDAFGKAQPDRTFHWFAEQLDAALTATVLPLALKGQEKAVKRIAVVGVGFFRVADAKGPLVPSAIVISNFLGPKREWLAEATSKCSVMVLRLREGVSHSWFAAGAQLSDAERRRLKRSIRRCVEHLTGPSAIVRLLGEMVRAVSARTETVGKSLLVGSIPASKVGFGYMFTAFGPHDFREPTFLYVPEGEDSARFFGPNIADRDIAACDPLVEPPENFDPKKWPDF